MKRRDRSLPSFLIRRLILALTCRRHQRRTNRLLSATTSVLFCGTGVNPYMLRRLTRRQAFIRAETPQVGNCALTFSPELHFQSLQGEGRAPLLKGESCKQAASHGDRHLTTERSHTYTGDNTHNAVRKGGWGGGELAPFPPPPAAKTAPGSSPLPLPPALDVNVRELRLTGRLLRRA